MVPPPRDLSGASLRRGSPCSPTTTVGMISALLLPASSSCATRARPASRRHIVNIVAKRFPSCDSLVSVSTCCWQGRSNVWFSRTWHLSSTLHCTATCQLSMGDGLRNAVHSLAFLTEESRLLRPLSCDCNHRVSPFLFQPGCMSG